MKKGIFVIGILSIFLATRAEAGLSFIKTITLLTKDREDILLQQKFYAEGDMVRVEEESSGIEGNPGVRIYDFQKKKLYTIMLDIKLYMEQDIGIEKDHLMFEIPPEKRYSGQEGVKVVKTKEGEETLQDRPVSRYEVKVIRKGEKGKEEQVLERYLLWVAEDQDEMPVRYEFDLPNQSKRIIHFTDIKTGAMGPSLFSIPEGYRSVSPF